VLGKGVDRYLAYNVEEKEEIFLRKSFTVENLEEDINKLFEKIEKLKEENEKLKRELEKEQKWWDKWFNAPRIRWTSSDDYKQVAKNLSDAGIKSVGYQLSINSSEYIYEYVSSSNSDNVSLGRRMIKCVYEYYKNQ